MLLFKPTVKKSNLLREATPYNMRIVRSAKRLWIMIRHLTELCPAVIGITHGVSTIGFVAFFTTRLRARCAVPR
jgi:hypothetical protein